MVNGVCIRVRVPEGQPGFSVRIIPYLGKTRSGVRKFGLLSRFDIRSLRCGSADDEMLSFPLNMLKAMLVGGHVDHIRVLP